MGTAIFNGKEAFTRIEDRQRQAAEIERASFARGNVRGRGDANPVHTVTGSIG